MELSEEDLLNFADFVKAKQATSQLKQYIYDWDINQREKRSFYINKKPKGKSQNKAEAHDGSLYKSAVTVKSSTKSVKRKL